MGMSAVRFRPPPAHHSHGRRPTSDLLIEDIKAFYDITEEKAP